MLIVLFFAFGIWVYLYYKKNFTAENFVLGFFYSVVTSILLSLFYDLFTRKDNKLIQEEDSAEMKAALSQELLPYLDFSTVPAEKQKSFIARLYKDDQFMTVLSELFLHNNGSQLFYNLLKPLRERNILINVEVENVLRAGANENYLLEFTQTFGTTENLKEFVVLYSCDNDVFNKIFFLNTCVVHAAVGVSGSAWATIDETIDSMYLKGERISNGKKESVVITPQHLVADRLCQRIPPEVTDLSCVKMIVYQLPELHSEYEFEFHYEVENSLSDPYYYWSAENPMHLRQISFNYKDIQSQIGDISANCIMGNYMYEPVHDRRRGTFTVKTNSLIYPGNGALLVWRPKNVS